MIWYESLYETSSHGWALLRLSEGSIIASSPLFRPWRALEEFFADRPEWIQPLEVVGHPGMAFVVKQGGD